MKRFLSVSVYWAAIHSGYGFSMGDGIDIECRIMRFGETGSEWLKIVLVTRIISSEGAHSIRLFNRKGIVTGNIKVGDY